MNLCFRHETLSSPSLSISHSSLSETQRLTDTNTDRRKYLTKLVEEGHYNAASIIDQVMTEIKDEHQKKLREVTDPRRMKFKQLKEKCAEYGIETKGCVVSESWSER